MHTVKKVNLKLYLGLSLSITFTLLCFSSWKTSQVLGMIGCSLGISLGLLATAQGVFLLTNSVLDTKVFVRKMLRGYLCLAALKLPFLVGVLWGSIHFMDGLVILPLALYVGQIVVLFFCLK